MTVSVPTPGAAAESPAWKPPQGAFDREHYLDAQRRNRRASWRAAAVAVPCVAIVGIPLSLFLTPLLLAPAIAVALLLHAFGLLPTDAYLLMRNAAHVLPDSWAAVWGKGTALPIDLIVAMLVLPGAATLFLAWIGLRLAFRREWSGNALERLRTRAADPGNERERMLLNIVEELAVAGAVRPPAVAIVESPTCNALALGFDLEQSTIVATTGLLQRLDRAEIQGIVAHLIASIGNGDLKIASTFFSAFAAFGMAGLIMDAPFSPEARAGLSGFWRGMRDKLFGRPNPAANREAIDIMLEGTDFGMFFRYIDLAPIRHHPLRAVIVDLPLMISATVLSIAAKAAIQFFTALIASPPMGRLWRSRRLLADAGAVELARQPDRLSSALSKMHKSDMALPGGGPLYFLCADWSVEEKIAANRSDVANNLIGMLVEPEKRFKHLRRLGAVTDFSPRKQDLAWVRELLVGLALGTVLLTFLFAYGMVVIGLFLWWLWSALEDILVNAPAALFQLLT